MHLALCLNTLLLILLVYIHLTMVISVATRLCKVTCIHIKSPHFLSLMKHTFKDKTRTKLKTCVISNELQMCRLLRTAAEILIHVELN